MKTTAERQRCAGRRAVAAAFLAATSAAAFAQVWTETSAPLTNWSSIASSADGSKLAAASDGAIYTSTNSGSSWMPTSAPVTNWQSISSSADGRKLVASGSAGLYTSWDFGVTWVERTNLWFRSLASSADGTRLIGGGNGTWISSDSGVTWMMATFGAYCVASSADGMRLAMGTFAYNGFPSGGIFISTNAGTDWTQTSAPLASWTGWTSLAASADGTKLFAAIGSTYFPTGPGPIFASTDSGENWRAAASPTSHWFSVACSTDGSKLVAAADRLYTSLDSGATWISNSVPVASWSAVACSADGAKLVAVVDGGGIWTAQSTPAPKLNTTSYGNGFVISWIVPSIDFALQQNSDLNTTNWIDVPTIPTRNDTSLVRGMRAHVARPAVVSA